MTRHRIGTTDLIARLEAAEGGSFELDVEILVLLGWTYSRRLSPHGYWEPPAWWVATGNDPLPYPTTSLDAIVALIEEKLPGWTTDVHTADASPCTYPVHWRVESVRFDDCTAGIYYQHPKMEERELGEGCGKTPVLALCIALLRAIKEGADG